MLTIQIWVSPDNFIHQKYNFTTINRKAYIQQNHYKMIFWRIQCFFHINIHKRVQKIWLWSFSSKFEENRNFINIFNTAWMWEVVKWWNSQDTMLDQYSTSPENFVNIRWFYLNITKYIPRLHDFPQTWA